MLFRGKIRNSEHRANKKKLWRREKAVEVKEYLRNSIIDLDFQSQWSIL